VLLEGVSEPDSGSDKSAFSAPDEQEECSRLQMSELDFVIHDQYSLFFDSCFSSSVCQVTNHRLD